MNTFVNASKAKVMAMGSSADLSEIWAPIWVENALGDNEIYIATLNVASGDIDFEKLLGHGMQKFEP